MTVEKVVLFCIAIAALWLMGQRWFWTLLFFVGALASFFAMVASVIHFQILGAVGFFFLMAVFGALQAWVQDGG
jgi:hypothetical protein